MMAAGKRWAWKILAAWLWAALALDAGARNSPVGHPTFLSPHASPLALHGDRLYVVNTPADTLDIIDTLSQTVVLRIPVGIDPVSVAVRPDGLEAWVSNHVSDSISIIDLDPDSRTLHQVVHTLQDLDPVTGVTRFDEPVGIAFAGNDKAYVALSSENQVAVFDVTARRLTRRLNIAAQDPRDLVVRNHRLFVIPFESNNQTQISGCTGPLVGDLCTFDATEHVVTNNNVLSLGIDVDIVRHPQVPDRDLFVFDTTTDQPVDVVNGLGTLLYGITVDSQGRVFVAQADARNDANGFAGTQGDDLRQMDNRAFLNQVTRVDCAGPCQPPLRYDLEPLPPSNPPPGQALATPYAIAVSDDDATLFVTAAGSDRLFTLEAATGAVLGRVAVEAVPRGLALRSGDNGRAEEAWVFNAVSNSVTRVDVSDPAQPVALATVSLDDPTDPVIKHGRRAFNTASASTSETFSCESCHPDGNTDQLPWVLDTPACGPGDNPQLGDANSINELRNGCTQVPPRITMPIRGLRDTAPYHWDGIPGDPYGGINTASVLSLEDPNCSREDPASCTRNLVDGSLATTLCDPLDCPDNEDGQPGALTEADRDAMARFLLAIPYPPAQRRAIDNVLTDRAQLGFSLFHIEGDQQGDPTPNVCGNCHRMPFWVSTNSPGTGMEAPTWRGAWDRWLILPQGRLNIIDFDFFRNIANTGTPERQVWRLSWAGRTRFDPVWDMVIEGSTGFAGAFARQWTLSAATADLDQTGRVLDALERAAREGGVVLQGEGLWLDAESATPMTVEFDRDQYVDRNHPERRWKRGRLLRQARDSGLVLTLTARIGHRVGLAHPQPALWTTGDLHRQRGPQLFPNLDNEDPVVRLSGRHVQPGAHVLVDGVRIAAQVRCASGQLPDCLGEALEIQLSRLPETAGTHFLQVQNPAGLVSNDFIIRTHTPGPATLKQDVSGPWFNPVQDGHGWFIEQLPGGRMVAYWYVYHEGEPLWLISQGRLVDGIAQLDTFITAGADFPPDFDPDDVSLQTWGRVDFEFVDDDTGQVSWAPLLPGFEAGRMDLQRIAPIADDPGACRSGSWFQPSQSGHGMVAHVVDVDGSAVVLLSWYVYHDGAPVWLLGQAPLDGDGADIPLRAYTGADFPPSFSTDDVMTSPWGTLMLRFTGDDTARADWDTSAPGTLSGGLDLVRLTELDAHECAD